jgi:hypothetical protein
MFSSQSHVKFLPVIAMGFMFGGNIKTEIAGNWIGTCQEQKITPDEPDSKVSVGEKSTHTINIKFDEDLLEIKERFKNQDSQIWVRSSDFANELSVSPTQLIESKYKILKYKIVVQSELSIKETKDSSGQSLPPNFSRILKVGNLQYEINLINGELQMKKTMRISKLLKLPSLINIKPNELCSFHRLRSKVLSE